jgi:hypothetical protein
MGIIRLKRRTPACPKWFFTDEPYAGKGACLQRLRLNIHFAKATFPPLIGNERLVKFGKVKIGPEGFGDVDFGVG